MFSNPCLLIGFKKLGKRNQLVHFRKNGFELFFRDVPRERKSILFNRHQLILSAGVSKIHLNIRRSIMISRLCRVPLQRVVDIFPFSVFLIVYLVAVNCSDKRPILGHKMLGESIPFFRDLLHNSIYLFFLRCDVVHNVLGLRR